MKLEIVSDVNKDDMNTGVIYNTNENNTTTNTSTTTITTNNIDIENNVEEEKKSYFTFKKWVGKCRVFYYHKGKPLYMIGPNCNIIIINIIKLL